MKKIKIILFLIANTILGQSTISEKLVQAYPNIILKVANNKVYFKNGNTLLFDDGIKNKTEEQLLNNPDIEDQFVYPYKKGAQDNPTKDPGRIRNEAFFKNIYGASKSDVENNLVEIVWCPKTINKKIKVTKVNKVNVALQRISNELDNMPNIKKYISNIGGTFMWRKIAGTNRLSGHSFGMTIDINVAFSNYWQWDCKCQNEYSKLKYKNKIPQQIVDVFEKNGFIWGGKWLHYDTMHFEYRPELL